MNADAADARYAREVLDAISEARERISHFDVTRTTFTEEGDVETRAVADSLLMCVLRVTEAAGKLSDEARAAHPEISWQGIRGMRNILAHDYGYVDREIVWAAINKDFDLLEQACREIVAP